MAGAVVAGAGLVLAFSPSEAAPTAVPIPTASMGQPVTPDGALQYTVTSFECGGTGAKGHFCTVGLTVKNISGTATRPGIAFARAQDAQGAEYLPDAVAQIRAKSALLNDLPPGTQITDRLIYDVPKAVTPTTLVLRQSPPNPAIRITLTKTPATP
ncbi:DUF4352 domain-containing protein [Paractinoplanes rishiriensis]|uniref:DUF4352 domain-containing protein n=1 Tax=Paractinoplanes rishiriensis TaxID=1050105 RepID=UPI0019439F68|nr:DUF4352 domain-containing protein [Actinoplanes rishiriensis]